MPKNTLHKTERVRSKRVIDELFSNSGKSLVAYSFRFSWVYTEAQIVPCSVIFISPKKKLKTAVERNLRKRLLRELYRLNKSELIENLKVSGIAIALSINYVGIEPLKFTKHQPLFQKAIKKLILEIQKQHSVPVHPAH